MSDDELEIIIGVAKKLAYKFTFGYYDYDDIVQEGVIYGLEKYEEWDNKRPLAAFMYFIIANHLKNLKRNKYFRLDTKCSLHSVYNEDCTDCRKKMSNNERKRNLVDTLDITNISDEAEPRTHDQSEAIDAAILTEFEESLLHALTFNERLDYLRLKDGFKIPYARRLKLEAIILEKLSE